MTRTIESMCRPLHNQRGQSLVLVGIGLGSAAFLFLAVVGVDIGRLAFTATEVQTLADATAVTAARGLLDTNNTTTATTAANTVAADNRVDGSPASASSTVPCPSQPCAGLTWGYVDPSTWGFSAGLNPDTGTYTAVQSDGLATVNNILAAMMGASTSTVTKRARASFTGVGQATPGLPLAVCAECSNTTDCLGSGCISLSEAPTGSNTSAWTGFFGGTGTSSIANFLPNCDNNCNCTSASSSIPQLTAGTDTLNLNNGQQSSSSLLQPIQCLVCPPSNITSFLIPVIQCGGCGTPINQSAKVIGFTTVTINSFKYSNGDVSLCGPSNGSLKSMNLTSARSVDDQAPPGGGLFGTLTVGMVG